MFVRPGAISADDKSTLHGAGVLVIEIDDPQSAKLVRAGVELEAGAVLNAAAKAVRVSEYAQRAFGVAVAEAIELQFKSSQQ
jgi:hypothetical protein